MQLKLTMAWMEEVENDFAEKFEEVLVVTQHERD